MKSFIAVSAAIVIALLAAASARAGNYQNFTVAVYCPVGVTKQMSDPKVLAESWDRITSQVKIDKVYLETYRSRQVVDESTIEPIKKFFTDKGVTVCGGITLASNDSNQFQTFSYADPKDRDEVKRMVEMTARHFDTIILDDFFFYCTKTDADIAAKGEKSWTQYRLEAMRDASENLVVKPAKAVNPNVKMIVKYPNWYEHFAGLGYDLEIQPKIFDAIYTGTETRDPGITDQHLQQYESYLVWRYFHNIKPGGNLGGWVDTFSVRYIDRYAEQLWDTMFAKAPEITLFNWYPLVRQEVTPGDRAEWQDKHTSFDYDAMQKPMATTRPTWARAAGYSLEQVDAFLGKLGQPIGLASYRPYHATGEDFLHNYLGMIGIPIELYPTFPTDAPIVLLTESAKFDPDIVAKIKAQLVAGKNVVITSGLLRALQGKGIEDVVELEYTDHKVAVREFLGGFGAGSGAGLAGGGDQTPEILIPEIRFLTNDAWQLVRGVANGKGYPILLMDRYSKGVLFVLTIPENFNDLYNLPRPVLSAIKNHVLREFPVWVDGPSQVALFAYDNNTFIVQSFLPEDCTVSVVVAGGFTKLRDLQSGDVLSGEPPVQPGGRRGGAPQGPARLNFSVKLPPHSYRVYAAEK
ncbi:MAG TPA: hypothetical protein VH518_12290 [Tepidisphaeraceae bacterium]|jgi:hypothetical protein